MLAGASPREALRRLLRRAPTGCAGWTSCAARCASGPRRPAAAAGWTAPWSRSGSCWTGRSRPSGGRCSPTRTTPPGWPRRELDALPDDTARAVRALADYQWRSDEARQAYEEIQDLLRREVLDSSVPRDAGRAARRDRARTCSAVRDMVADLNEMLEADARGEHTQEQFDRVHGAVRRVLPGATRRPSPSWSTRWPAGPPPSSGCWTACPTEQRPGAGRPDGRRARRRRAGRARWPGCSSSCARPGRTCAGAARERMPTASGRSGSATRPARCRSSPTWTSWTRCSTRTTPGASLDDIDEELLERALGRQAVDDLEALRRVERELQRQGYLNRSGGALELTPQGGAPAGRDRAAPGLRRCWTPRGRGDHDVARRRRRRRADRVESRDWRVRRRAAAGRRPHGPQRRPAHGGPRRAPGGRAARG